VIAVSGDLSPARFGELDRLVTDALDHGHRHLGLDLHGRAQHRLLSTGVVVGCAAGRSPQGWQAHCGGSPDAASPGAQGAQFGRPAALRTVGAVESASHKGDARS